jgi:hypothetical protein
MSKQIVPEDATYRYEHMSVRIAWIEATVKKLLRFKVNRLKKVIKINKIN